MVFKWHIPDYHALQNEDEVRAAIARLHPGPGEYLIPHCSDPKELRSPGMQQKFRDGPVALLVLRRPGLPQMGPQLGLWFLYTVVIAAIAAYLASRTLAPGAATLMVLRQVSVVVFVTLVGGSVQNAIWMGKPWRVVAKDMLDAVLYAAATGAIFAWLWPH
jgi:hypothetical protein